MWKLSNFHGRSTWAPSIIAGERSRKYWNVPVTLISGQHSADWMFLSPRDFYSDRMIFSSPFIKQTKNSLGSDLTYQFGIPWTWSRHSLRNPGPTLLLLWGKVWCSRNAMMPCYNEGYVTLANMQYLLSRLWRNEFSEFQQKCMCLLDIFNYYTGILFFSSFYQLAD